MNAVDTINSLLVFGYIIFGFINIKSVMRDKVIKGISIYFVYFIVIVSTWNMYYYYSLEQYISMILAIILCIINIIWSSLILYYKR